jgi:hypothetical protein
LAAQLNADVTKAAQRNWRRLVGNFINPVPQKFSGNDMDFPDPWQLFGVAHERHDRPKA